MVVDINEIPITNHNLFYKEFKTTLIFAHEWWTYKGINYLFFGSVKITWVSKKQYVYIRMNYFGDLNTFYVHAKDK